MHKRRARRARNGTQMVLASRCVYSAAVTTAAVQTATCPLSLISQVSPVNPLVTLVVTSSGGDSRCTITWQNLRFGSLMSLAKPRPADCGAER